MSSKTKLAASVAIMLAMIFVGIVVAIPLLKEAGAPAQGTNMTTDTVNSVGAADASSLALVGVTVAVAAGLILVISWLGYDSEAYERLGWLAQYLYSMVEYAAWGLATVMVVVGPAALVYYVGRSASAHSDTLYMLAKWAGIIGLVFVALAGLGYLSKKYGLGRALDNYRAHKEVH